MKNLFIFIFAIASLNAFSSELDCLKPGSRIQLDKKTVTIEGEAALNAELAALANDTQGSSKVTVKITFPKKDLKCSTGLPRVFNCSGATKKASVELTISQRSAFGSSSMQLSQRPVKIQNIDISSNIGAQGPVVIGEGPTTVNLDQVSVRSTMIARMNGDLPLEIQQSFSGNTECK